MLHPAGVVLGIHHNTGNDGSAFQLELYSG